MRFFGGQDFQPRPAYFDRIPVPQGLQCLICTRHFLPDDRGIVMPWSTDDDGEASCAYHLECFAKDVLGFKVPEPSQ